ncbi:MAG: amidohydrolase family protein [Coriobacteriales bacterium]|jgi:predicted TIM-barrel fold metal-dependent hydrolase|nr:amidohydrolase family protein [Coriobacteriales bacterium]
MTIQLTTGPTPVIDFHVHVYPEKLAPRVMAAFSKFPILIGTDGTVAAWLAHMDAAGVDKSVLLTVPTKPAQVVAANDFLRPLLYHDRFIPFAGVHPACEDAAGIVRRAAREGFRGIKLHPIMQGFKPQDARMFPIYDAAIDAEMVILFHAGAGMDFDAEDKPMSTTNAARGTLADFAALFAQRDYGQYQRFVFAHLGGRPNFQQFPDFKRGWPGYLDLAYTMGLMPDEHLLALARDFGCDRILFGTDGPWADEQRDLDYLLHIGFDDDELRGILYNNAAQLLGLEKR